MQISTEILIGKLDGSTGNYIQSQIECNDCTHKHVDSSPTDGNIQLTTIQTKKEGHDEKNEDENKSCTESERDEEVSGFRDIKIRELLKLKDVNMSVLESPRRRGTTTTEGSKIYNSTDSSSESDKEEKKKAEGWISISMVRKSSVLREDKSRQSFESFANEENVADIFLKMWQHHQNEEKNGRTKIASCEEEKDDQVIDKQWSEKWAGRYVLLGCPETSKKKDKRRHRWLQSSNESGDHHGSNTLILGDCTWRALWKVESLPIPASSQSRRNSRSNSSNCMITNTGGTSPSTRGPPALEERAERYVLLRGANGKYLSVTETKGLSAGTDAHSICQYTILSLFFQTTQVRLGTMRCADGCG